MNAIEQGIGHQVLEDGLGFEIKEVISTQTDQGDECRHKALVL